MNEAKEKAAEKAKKIKKCKTLMKMAKYFVKIFCWSSVAVLILGATIIIFSRWFPFLAFKWFCQI